ncbi:hypothetical protein HanIR_Chr06g0261011 [Helianthus annuus]|nr:hypothetical protein HanIR_Chr06g0261011 [Helianthus annuus]
MVRAIFFENQRRSYFNYISDRFEWRNRHIIRLRMTRMMICRRFDAVRMNIWCIYILQY